MQYDFRVVYISGITKAVAKALWRRPLSSPKCAATALICDDSHLLPKLRSYLLDTHAAAIWAKLNTRRRVKYYRVENDILWFQKGRGTHRLQVAASL